MTHAPALSRCLERVPWGRLPRAGALATAALAEWLYRHYFIVWRPSSLPRTETAGSPWFVAELGARCAGPVTFEPGFRVHQRLATGVFVHSPHIGLWVARGAVRPAGARRGQAVSVALPCAREAAMPGFFFIVSRAGHPDPAAPHLKFYVNATPGGALALMQGLLHERSLRSARFDAKVTNDPARFGRRDTLLVYVAPKDAPRVADYLVSFARRRPAALLSQTPPMTVRLGHGVAVAESPPHGESFGAHRCRLVAEGLLTARAERRSPLEVVAERFEREGLDWETPWFDRLPRGWLDLVTA